MGHFPCFFFFPHAHFFYAANFTFLVAKTSQKSRDVKVYDFYGND